MSSFPQSISKGFIGLSLGVVLLATATTAVLWPSLDSFAAARSQELANRADRGVVDEYTGYRAALLLDGQNGHAREKLGRQYLLRWQPERALDLAGERCESACSLREDALLELGRALEAPSEPSDALVRAQAYYQRGLPQSALRSLQNAPESTLKHHLTARIHLERPNTGEAGLQTAEQAAGSGLALDPSNIMLREDMRDIYAARGDRLRADAEAKEIDRLRSGRF